VGRGIIETTRTIEVRDAYLELGSYAAVGERFGISRERVRQILTKGVFYKLFPDPVRKVFAKKGRKVKMAVSNPNTRYGQKKKSRKKKRAVGK